jgi:alkylresorcinol/alkylpyrone synthase
VLKKFGNMSSPTALFVLTRQIYQLERPRPESKGVLLSLGPGFAAEGVVLEW